MTGPSEPDDSPERTIENPDLEHRADAAEPDAEAEQESGKKKRGALREFAILVSIALVLYYVMLTFIARPYLIPSESMEPTLHGCNGCVGDRIMVDEYQDVNELQARWLGLVVRDHNNITAVGDDDQAIYGWRGADVNYILQFERSYPGAGIVKLERNYRCSRRIIAAANAVIANNEMRRGKLLKAAASDEEGRKIRIASAVDGEMEAAWIAREIERIGAETEIVLLYRANFQSRPLEEGLVSAGIAYTIVGDDCFYDRLEIRDALAYVELALYGRDEAEGERAFDAFARIHDRPAPGRRRGIPLCHRRGPWKAIVLRSGRSGRERSAGAGP